nr:reverse transcriptase domain-containing protein [Tanacetum cinerariifolium]
EKQLDKEDFQEIESMAAFNAILEFRDTLIQHLESVKKSIDERAQLQREYDRWVNERQMHATKEKNTSSRSGNDVHADDVDIRPIYDEEPMAEVQTTAEIDVFAIGQQHTEQPKFNNEGEVIQNAKECHDTCPLPDILTDNQIPEPLYPSLESEKKFLKRTVAKFQKDFSRLEAHCVNLELKYQNQFLNKGQQSQFLKDKSNEAKVKHNIDVIETINIELEHKVAKLHKENETLKKNYKELFDSIKITRSKTIEHTTSLIATNDKFKAQLQEKGSAITALKNELRKSTGNSVDTKFVKSSILGKPMSQPLRNQSIVRQPTAFKSERPRISKPWCDSHVDVHNDLSKPVTTHYLPKKREDASAKHHHMIASSNSRISSKNMTRFSSNDMVETTGKIFKTVGLRWVPTGKIFTSNTTKVDSEPLNGSNADITNQYECERTLNLSACTSFNPKRKDSDSELELHDHSNEQSSSKLVLKVVPPADITARALIDVHDEEMILRDEDERLTLNMKHDTASYSKHPHRDSVNLINIFNIPSEDYLEDLVSNKKSGNPTFSLHKEITSTTYSANSLLEESTDELALITYLPDYDDNHTCDIESDLREIDFLLYQGEDSDFKDSVNQTNLANRDDLFVDPTPEMFTDEQHLDYSFPPRFDVYPDDFLEIESDANNFDDDFFDSKGEKIKQDDDLPSPNNEDKVFNPGILIYEKSVKIITRVAQEKKLAISFASLLFEDFDPPFYEPLVFKELPEKLGDPGKFLILCGFSELKCKDLADLEASINMMPLSIWKKLGLLDLIPTWMTLEVANRAICTPDGIARDVFVPVGKFTFPTDFVVVDYESDPRVPLILGRPLLRTARALIDVHDEEMILRDEDERLTLNMKHDTASYSKHPHRDSVNSINIFNIPSEDYLEDLVSNKKSGNPTFSLHKEITSTTYSANSLLEESTDELALITYLPDYDDNRTCDIESDLREIEFLLYQGEDFDFKDSVDQTNLANRDDLFVDPTPEMFTDEQPLDYSFPPRFDVYPDDFLEIEDDDLPSPDNEDKVFNPGILIHEKSVKIITRVAQEKKLAISFASLLFEDFDPPFYEPLVFKEVPNSIRLLSFSSKN